MGGSVALREAADRLDAQASRVTTALRAVHTTRRRTAWAGPAARRLDTELTARQRTLDGTAGRLRALAARLRATARAVAAAEGR